MKCVQPPSAFAEHSPHPRLPLPLPMRARRQSIQFEDEAMKISGWVLSGVLLSMCAFGSATAEVVRVRVTARVTNVSDPTHALSNKVVVGQRVTGTYVYNTNTPNQGDENIGWYTPYVGEARV